MHLVEADTYHNSFHITSLQSIFKIIDKFGYFVIDITIFYDILRNMRTRGKSRHVRKRKKYLSKYSRLYGYSIPEIMEILNWPYTTVHNWINDKEKRNLLLNYVKAEVEAEEDAVSEQDYREQNPLERPRE